MVSVNIPTLNSSKTIGQCLDAVAKQDYENFEIIVIDSYSSDKTAQIANGFGAKVVFTRGLTMQRLRGIAESKGDYILLLDSDQVVPVDLLKKCVSKLQREPRSDAIVIPEISVPTFENSFASGQSTYLRLGQLSGATGKGICIPRFFRARILRSIKPPRRELGYFDHAWIWSKASEMGARATTGDSSLFHLERNYPSLMAKKFFGYYGHHLLPALIEDWRVVLARSAPKTTVMGSLTSLTARERVQLVGLFGMKIFLTIIGTLHYLLFGSKK